LAVSTKIIQPFFHASEPATLQVSVLFAAKLQMDTGLRRRNASERVNRMSVVRFWATLRTVRLANIVRKLGKANDAKIPAIARTTSNSIRVNPLRRFFIALAYTKILTSHEQSDGRKVEGVER